MASKRDKIIGIIVACIIGLACLIVMFSGDYYYNKAEDKFDQGEYHEALELLIKAEDNRHRADPNSDIYFLRGKCCFELEKYDEALKYAQEALEREYSDEAELRNFIYKIETILLEQEPEQKQGQEPAQTRSDNTVSSKITAPYLITPTSVSDIELALYSEDIFCIYDREYYGYIDRTGNEVTGFVYDMAYPFSEDLACAMIDGIYGFVNKNGEVAIPFNYLDAAPFSEGLAYFVTEDEYGFLNKDGTVAFTLNCDSVSSFKEDRAYFSLDGKYGYIDKKGHIVIDPKYQDADYFKDGLAIVKNNGLFGMIDRNGREIIPLQYDTILRDSEKIEAKTGELIEYFDLSGNAILDEVISEETYSVTIANGTDDYTITKEDDVITIQDKQGNTVLSIDYYIDRSVYGNYDYKVLSYFDNDKPDKILIVNDSEGYEIPQVLLQNRITPRNQLYWKLSHGKYINLGYTSGEIEEVRKYNTWNETNYIKYFKLYDIENSGNPILYCMEEPCFQPGFTLSDSAFYTIIDDELQCLLTGYECGGSARGDYVCLWKDMTTGEEYIGTRGFAGGFGGYASWGNVYDYQHGNLSQVVSFDWVGQNAGNYTDETLLDNAHLFYDDNDIPYTQETILTVDCVNEYLVNNKQTTLEEYKKYSERYTSYNLLE